MCALSRYFFDVRNRTLSHDDEVGTECANLEAIRHRAQQVLGQTIAAEPFHADGLHVVVSVRNQSRDRVFMATALVVGNTL
ncbi:DUF6894 family protein [Methylobacterium sp. C25]|uniref:DUF6894 family protein n=1 Tax=Methylobacterium sp. C25 TaxID=2721622 RepID=UPI003FA35ABF